MLMTGTVLVVYEKNIEHHMTKLWHYYLSQLMLDICTSILLTDYNQGTVL
jgi:hypothetical protein